MQPNPASFVGNKARNNVYQIITEQVNVKMNNEQEVRQVLNPLRAVAEETGVAIVGVMHLNKKEDLRAVNRISGAMAFVGVSRIVWLFESDKDNPDEFQMLCIKQNIGKRVAGLRYRIENREVLIQNKPSAQPYVRWIGETEKSADDALVSTPAHGPKELDRASEWLNGFLSDGPKRATEIEQAAKHVGFSERTLDRAKQEIGARSTKKMDGWYWELEGSQP